METHCVRITDPWDGDVLNRHDGTETDDALTVQIAGSAPVGSTVTVNGAEATVEGETFRCPLRLTERRNRVEAVARRGDTLWKDSITLLWDKESRPRYRFSVDDNIEFLRDLGAEPDRYESLFDHWYLAFWREMHRRFGAKIHVNIYYRTPGEEFTLAQMPDKWKSEWRDNAAWLHLTFHALQNTPNRLYRDATYERMARDYELVTGEIRRFAGEEVLSTFTTVHWAEAPRHACQALCDRGVRGLIGLFRRNANGDCNTGYYLPERLKDHLDNRDCWYDPAMDLVFITCDAVVNGLALERIEPHLEAQASSPHTSELIELLIHEQYFRKELRHYQPDIDDKVVRALTWVSERDYAPVFWGEEFRA